jgi:hypothetical protein
MNVGRAQCAVSWATGDAYPGVKGIVHELAYADPDGNGPLPVQVVMTGQFDLAGTTVANSIASWDPATGT